MGDIDGLLVYTGSYALVLSFLHIVISVLSIGQFFCFFNWLLNYAPSVWINILYYNNPSCRATINIGHVVDGMPNQAFAYFISQPSSSVKHLIINGLYLSINLVWFGTSLGLVGGGAARNRRTSYKITWLVMTSSQCCVELAAIICYVVDYPHTQFLSDLVAYVGGRLSGAGNVDVDTSSAVFTMLAVYTRFGITFIIQGVFFILVLVNTFKRRVEVNEEQQLQDIFSDDKDWPDNRNLPRPRLNSRTSVNHRSIEESTPKDVAIDNTSRENVSTSPPTGKELKKVSQNVSFPTSLMSLPQHLESIMVEQQRKLDRAVVDTVGNRGSPANRVSYDDVQPSTSAAARLQERRGTNATLQAQLPWSYIPTAVNRMRDQLPPDEELPPVPVPDYTLHPTYRKASVHRANSSVSKTTANELENTTGPVLPDPTGSTGSIGSTCLTGSTYSLNSTSIQLEEARRAVLMEQAAAVDALNLGYVDLTPYRFIEETWL